PHPRQLADLAPVRPGRPLPGQGGGHRLPPAAPQRLLVRRQSAGLLPGRQAGAPALLSPNLAGPGTHAVLSGIPPAHRFDPADGGRRAALERAGGLETPVVGGLNRNTRRPASITYTKVEPGGGA